VDPLSFVRAAQPFGPLSEAAVARLGATVEIVYVPRGQPVTSPDASRDHVYLVRKGVVRVERDGHVAHLEEGEVFGGTLGAFAAPLQARAEEDALLYRWPSEVAEAVARPPATAAGPGLLEEVGALVRRPPVWVLPDVSCREAAQRMAQEGVSSVLVAQPAVAAQALPARQVVGILTDRDLRTRVLARGLGGDTPVREVMTSPVHFVEAGLPTFVAVLRMLELGVHHLPVVRGDRVVGMVTDTDLVRLQAHSPLFLWKRLEAGEVARYAEEVAQTAQALLDAGVDVVQACRVVSHLHAVLCRRLLRDAQAALGDSPVPFAWTVCGSEGREEQVLPTDQDNFLVVATEGHEDYFAGLAEDVGKGLEAAGFPLCPGGYMATRWRMSLAGWTAAFRTWMADPQGENLLHLQVFADFRPVGGTLSLDPLQDVLRSAQGSPVLLAHLARSCLGFQVPLGPFRSLRATGGQLDLKAGLVAPVVCAARVLALAAGASERNTFQRLRAAREAGLIGDEDAGAAADALAFGLRLRLVHQLEARRRREPPANHVAVDRLSAWERRRLRESLWAARQLQERLRQRYHLYLWG
jgi:CBS domain-containing protein